MDGEWSGHIVVQGAGLIGGYIGGRLADAGAQVTLLGRSKLLDPVQAQGMWITDLDGADIHVAADKLSISTDPDVLAQADLIITTVKSAASENAGADLARYAKPETLVMSFQNGIQNADILQRAAPRLKVQACMVPYNITQPKAGHWHRGTQGKLYAPRAPDLVSLLPLFARAGLPLQLSDDMRGVLWSKLLLNLNNAVNALSGLTLLEELADRHYRRVVAACMEEALTALHYANIVPVQITALPPHKLPKIMRLPNFLYRMLALRKLRIDATARSSMAEDLAAGKSTEIDEINGAVVALGLKFRSATPVNEKIIALIKQAEKNKTQAMSGRDLCRAVGLT
jgi:2-dehydropantoate 2-reductase